MSGYAAGHGPVAGRGRHHRRNDLHTFRKEAAMILESTPLAQVDWERPGARLYHIPFTFDNAWGRVRVPLYVACAPQQLSYMATARESPAR